MVFCFVFLRKRVQAMGISRSFSLFVFSLFFTYDFSLEGGIFPPTLKSKES